MRKYYRGFSQMLHQISKDAMLVVMMVVPLLASTAIHFGVPFIEKYLTEYFNKYSILADYYLVFDILLAMMTPILFSFVGAMVVLGERDERIARYMSVTPLGKKGYLFTRIEIPVLISIVISVVIMSLAHLSKVSLVEIIVYSIFSGILGKIAALLIVCISKNKVEGMAIGKLSGFILLGAFVPFFINSNYQYLTCFIPSFWLGKAGQSDNLLYSVVGIIIAYIWIILLVGRFNKNISVE